MNDYPNLDHVKMEIVGEVCIPYEEDVYRQTFHPEPPARTEEDQ